MLYKNNMTIYSIGHDIVKNIRIANLLNKYDQHFTNKVLSVSEQETLKTKNNPTNFIAKRFAAKEAFAKACGIGLRHPILMPNITIANDKLGKPYFILDNSIQRWLLDKGIKHHHLSISDEDHVSSAFVILEC
jgi:holo-[acyl-carrier protein] synthase